MATNEISTTRYPALGQSVHIYNYLIDLIEDFLNRIHHNLHSNFDNIDFTTIL